MADLADVIPGFDLQPWRHLTYSLEKKKILTIELVSQDPVEIVRRCPLPLREVKRLIAAVNSAIFEDLTSTDVRKLGRQSETDTGPLDKSLPRREKNFIKKQRSFVRTLDYNFDVCLGGGFPTGNVSEIVGESAVGKTQFVLSLLLTAQLPVPKGLGRAVMYLSTEDQLNTSRLHQILETHPEYQTLTEKDRPTLDRVFTMSTRNYEQQQNIIQYKLPFLVEQNNVGLVVIDSVAANFRIQFPGAAPAILARRAAALNKLGHILKRIAHEHNIAVVVTNQVADRFDNARVVPDKLRTVLSTPSSSATTIRSTAPRGTQTSMGPPPPRSVNWSQVRKDEVMGLNYQQCFFTGWGNGADGPYDALKTPALGLAWANQLDARIALKLVNESHGNKTENIYADHKRKRYLSVVFAAWISPTVMSVEYELCARGPVSISLNDGQAYQQLQDLDDDSGNEHAEMDHDPANEIQEMLDPKYWEDDSDDDKDFLNVELDSSLASAPEKPKISLPFASSGAPKKNERIEPVKAV